MAYEQYGFNENLTKYDLAELKKYVDDLVKEAKANALNSAWPVGSVYITADNSHPNDRGIPGVWEELPRGYYLSTIDTDRATSKSVAAGGVGGKWDFRLGISHIPQHAHKIKYQVSNNMGSKPGYGLLRFLSNTDSGNVNKPVFFKIWFRRLWGTTNTGEDVWEIFNGPSPSTNIVRKTNADPASQQFDRLIQSSPVGKGQGRMSDSLSVDFSYATKIEGTTRWGIYDQQTYNSEDFYSDTGVTQTDVVYEPRFINLRAYKRKS